MNWYSIYISTLNLLNQVITLKNIRLSIRKCHTIYIFLFASVYFAFFCMVILIFPFVAAYPLLFCWDLK